MACPTPAAPAPLTNPAPEPNSASAESETLGDPLRDASTGRCVLARGIVGMTEASATNRLSKPWTHPSLSTTASGSVSGPILQVPTGCQCPPTHRRA
jgi:hypothetical protein